MCWFSGTRERAAVLCLVLQACYSSASHSVVCWQPSRAQPWHCFGAASINCTACVILVPCCQAARESWVASPGGAAAGAPAVDAAARTLLARWGGGWVPTVHGWLPLACNACASRARWRQWQGMDIRCWPHVPAGCAAACAGWMCGQPTSTTMPSTARQWRPCLHPRSGWHGTARQVGGDLDFHRVQWGWVQHVGA